MLVLNSPHHPKRDFLHDIVSQRVYYLEIFNSVCDCVGIYEQERKAFFLVNLTFHLKVNDRGVFFHILAFISVNTL